MSDIQELERQITLLAATQVGAPLPPDARIIVDRLLTALEQGTARAAQRGEDGKWRAIPWVKQGILLGFRIGQMVDMSLIGTLGDQGTTFGFFDKDLLP